MPHRKSIRPNKPGWIKEEAVPNAPESTPSTALSNPFRDAFHRLERFLDSQRKEPAVTNKFTVVGRLVINSNNLEEFKELYLNLSGGFPLQGQSVADMDAQTLANALAEYFLLSIEPLVEQSANKTLKRMHSAGAIYDVSHTSKGLIYAEDQEAEPPVLTLESDFTVGFSADCAKSVAQSIQKVIEAKVDGPQLKTWVYLDTSSSVDQQAY